MSTIDNHILSSFAPAALWEHFRRLTLIPRPSRHEAVATQYIAEVGRAAGHEVVVDEVGNVIIRAKATAGCEGLAPVVLQGHIDMVPQKTPESTHDFTRDPISVQVKDGWLMASGTTLGADNGVGVAAALAVVTDPSVEHGPLEVLVTVEEETSMAGANGLAEDALVGRMLFNLDSEQEGEVYVGCAGGVDVNATFRGTRVETASTDVAVRVTLSGLSGGHSGMDINLGRANANKLMARFLKFAAANYESMLSEIEGGNMRNAIPRECSTVLTIDAEDYDDFVEAVEEFEDIFRSEYAITEPHLRFAVAKVLLPATVMDEMTTDDLINALQGVPNGTLKMSGTIAGLVETSSNLAIVKSSGDSVAVQFLVRSSVDTEKEDVASSIDSIFRLAGAEVEFAGEYPGWNPNPSSTALRVVSESYERLYGCSPKVMAVHAGLECGIFSRTFADMDMVSFGPTIRHPHSPSEKVDIESVGRFWRLLTEALINVPKQ